MKTYNIIKNISKALIYFSCLVALISSAIWFINKNKASADTTFTSVSVSGYPSELQYSPGSVVTVPLGTISVSSPGIDHVSVFVAKNNFTYDPPKTDEGKQNICDRSKTNDGIYLMGQFKCSGSTCSNNSLSWETTSSTMAGRHQIFAVALNKDTSRTGCTASAIVGWSNTSSVINLQAPIPSGSNADKIHLEAFTSDGAAITDLNKFRKNKTVTFHVKLDSFPADVTSPIDHVSLLISKPEYFNTDTYSSALTRTTLCTEASNTGECQHLCPISLYKKCDSATGICEDFQWTPTNSGQHRLVVLAMTSPDGSACQPAGVAGYNGSEVVRVLNEDGSDPNTGSGDGDGDSDVRPVPVSIDDPFSGSISSTTALISKIFSLFVILINVFSLFGIIYGGIQFITSAGNSDNANKGKKTLIYSIVGIIIGIGTLVIEKSIIDIINNIVTGT